MCALLDRRLVIVAGKGGVGRTTVAAALGLSAARAGKRTVICEVAQQERLAGMFGVEPAGHEERELTAGLHAVSVDPERAMHEWLRHQLRSGALAGLLGGSRLFRYLTAAAPGVTELVTIGKLWDLAQLERRTGGTAYDLAIVDAPATGHGLALLSAPGTYARIARTGPVARHASQIAGFLRDPSSTGVLAVALPEEMPVNETVELEQRLRAELDIELNQVIVNGVLPARFRRAEIRRLRSLDSRGSEAARAAVRTALAEHERERGQQEQLERLRQAVAAPVGTLPFVYQPELRRRDLDELSRALEAAL